MPGRWKKRLRALLKRDALDRELDQVVGIFALSRDGPCEPAHARQQCDDLTAKFLMRITHALWG